MALVVRDPDPGRRRERYGIADDVWSRAWRVDTGAHARVAEAALRGVELFGAGTPAGTRLGRMSQFFGWLSAQMNDSSAADATVNEAFTLLAALAYAARPLTTGELAAALGWPRRRVTGALTAIDRRPVIADPLTVVSTAPDTYACVTRPDRLSPVQRAALRAAPGRPPDAGPVTRR